MSDEELIAELKKDRADNAAVDNACFDRLRRVAKDYGKDGVIARELIDKAANPLRPSAPVERRVVRCLVTDNPCGTDTWAVGKPCQCENCKNAPLYPCADCGKMRSQNEGGNVFTVCEDCWDQTYNVGGEERLAAHQPSQTTTATPQGVASTD